MARQNPEIVRLTGAINVSVNSLDGAAAFLRTLLREVKDDRLERQILFEIRRLGRSAKQLRLETESPDPEFAPTLLKRGLTFLRNAAFVAGAVGSAYTGADAFYENFVMPVEVEVVELTELGMIDSEATPSVAGKEIRGPWSAGTQQRSHNYQTVSVLEHHRVGPDRFPLWHETTHVIAATTDKVESYPYIFDTSTASVEAVFGASVSDVEPIEDIPGFAVARLEFTEAIEPGSSASFRYRTSFRYGELPPPEFRRGSRELAESITIRVEFDPEAIPASCREAIWHAPDTPAIETLGAELDEDHSLHLHLKSIEGALSGFEWSWPTFEEGTGPK